MDYILALDAGTTSIKAVLFDTQGRPAAIGAREYELSKPAPGIVELDPEIYWEAATAAIREVLARSGVPAGRIRALGLCSQGETLIVLDEAGRPLRPDRQASDSSRSKRSNWL